MPLLQVEAQELAERRFQVLGAVLRVAAGAAVAGPRVEIAIRGESELAAVVVRIGIPLEEELTNLHWRARQAARAVPHDPRVPVPVGVVHIEAAIGRVARVERDREQPLLATVQNEPSDVEERTSAKPPTNDDANPPRLLDDIDVVLLVPRRGHIDRLVEPAGDVHEPQLAPLRATCRTECCDGREHSQNEQSED